MRQFHDFFRKYAQAINFLLLFFVKGGLKAQILSSISIICKRLRNFSVNQLYQTCKTQFRDLF